MAGEGRESKKDNDLFYTCSLIDYIARKTKNTRADVVNKLGKQRIDKIYDLADICLLYTSYLLCFCRNMPATNVKLKICYDNKNI